MSHGLKFTEHGVFKTLGTVGQVFAGRMDRYEYHRILTPDTFDGDLSEAVTAHVHTLRFFPKLLAAWGGMIRLGDVSREHLGPVLTALWRSGCRETVEVFLSSALPDLLFAPPPLLSSGGECRGGTVRHGVPISFGQRFFHDGLYVHGLARNLLALADFRLLPCTPYPDVQGVEGVEAWLAAGKTPRFMLSVARKCRRRREGRRAGIVALAALVPFSSALSAERQARLIRSLAAIGEEEGGEAADVELGIRFRTPRDGVGGGESGAVASFPSLCASLFPPTRARGRRRGEPRGAKPTPSPPSLSEIRPQTPCSYPPSLKNSLRPTRCRTPAPSSPRGVTCDM